MNAKQDLFRSYEMQSAHKSQSFAVPCKTNSSLIIEPSNTSTQQNSGDNVRVFIRIRPPLEREIDTNDYSIPFRSIVIPSKSMKECNLVEYVGSQLDEREVQREWIESPHYFHFHKFTFDHVFDIDSSQELVYDIVGKPAVNSTLEGYNTTIFAYGQTGTGKTYTMEGFTYSQSDPKRGIVPRCIEDIFRYIEQSSNEESKFMVRASYLQIYNDSISDLLRPDKVNLNIREDKRKGIYVESLSEWGVRSTYDIYTLLERGAELRETSSTKMNDVSSRSHAVFTIVVEQLIGVETEETLDRGIIKKPLIKSAKLNLVDLAGSERIRITGAVGKQAEEGKKINKSLSALGNVIFALTDSKVRGHIPYRDSKLTRLLEDSLGGNCKTYMIATISPAQESFNESLSTLHFAKRAKTIKNKPKINEDKEQRSLLKQYEEELKNLRVELNKKVNEKTDVTSLEREKQRVEQEKNSALKMLEQTNLMYEEEKREKKRLEQKIKMMNSQVIKGGHKIDERVDHNIDERNIIKELELRIQEMDKEKRLFQEDKAEIEQYKTLLMKQRDIMVSLTNKLNERDEIIGQLQDDLEVADQRIIELENNLNKQNPEYEPGPYSVFSNSKHTESKYKKKVNLYPPEYASDSNKTSFLLTADEKIKELSEKLKESQSELKKLKSENNKSHSDLNASHLEKMKLENDKLMSQLEIQNNSANVYQKEKVIFQSKFRKDSENIIKNIFLALKENDIDVVKDDLNYLLKYIKNQMHDDIFPQFLKQENSVRTINTLTNKIYDFEFSRGRSSSSNHKNKIGSFEDTSISTLKRQMNEKNNFLEADSLENNIARENSFFSVSKPLKTADSAALRGREYDKTPANTNLICGVDSQFNDRDNKSKYRYNSKSPVDHRSSSNVNNNQNNQSSIESSSGKYEKFITSSNNVSTQLPSSVYNFKKIEQSPIARRKEIEKNYEENLNIYERTNNYPIMNSDCNIRENNQYELSSNIQTAGDYISKKTFNLRSMTNDNHQFQDPILDSTATRNSAFNPSNVSRFINKFLSK